MDIKNYIIKQIYSAETILLMLWAGMSVDSGIPDYRSSGGMYTSTSPFSDLPDFISLMSRGNTQEHQLQSTKIWIRQLHMFLSSKPHQGYDYFAGIANDRGQLPTAYRV